MKKQITTESGEAYFNEVYGDDAYSQVNVPRRRRKRIRNPEYCLTKEDVYSLLTESISEFVSYLTSFEECLDEDCVAEKLTRMFELLEDIIGELEQYEFYDETVKKLYPIIEHATDEIEELLEYSVNALNKDEISGLLWDVAADLVDSVNRWLNEED